MHDALIHHQSPEICPNCGEHMIGDGYTLPSHCPNAENDWWYEAPDSGPWYCNENDDDNNYYEPTEIDEWASFDPDC